MARPIERIEQDIVGLEKAIGAIAQELQNAYESYLSVLGQAVHQQLILATYHLCTQGYPEKFLRLSLNQRQKLQQAMRKLAKSASQDMQALLDRNDDELSETDEELEETNKELEEEKIEQELELKDDDLEEIAQELDIVDDDDLEEIAQELDIVDDDDLEEIAQQLEAEDGVKEVSTFSQSGNYTSIPQNVKIPTFSSQNPPSPVFSSEPALSKDWKNWFNPNTSNPMELASWQKNLEKAIAYILKSLSRDGNRLLQKTNILPQKLPESILEAAAAAAAASSSEGSTAIMPGGAPNLLSLVVGVEGEQLEAESLTQVMALNLRLVEIEFGDLNLSSERKQIRNILNQLGKLGREYQKQQREHSIATAEAAWRASWYED